MDTESIYQRQLIDCNCNDCVFMTRDVARFKASQQTHLEWQQKEYEQRKKKLIQSALEFRRKNELEKYNDILVQVDKMKFQFDKSEASIQFGQCDKFIKQVSFIPNHCQIETQQCFKHRKTNLKVIIENV